MAQINNGINSLNRNRKFVTSATSYTVLQTDDIIEISDTSAVRTVTLPAPSTTGSTCSNGKTYTIKDTSGAAVSNPIVVTPASGTIDGVTFLTIDTAWGSMQVYSDGANYFSIQRSIPQVAFQTFVLINQTVTAGSTATVNVTANFDQGNNIPGTTFTAPIQGTYFFSTTLSLNIASTETSTTVVRIRTTGQDYTTSISNIPFAGATASVTLAIATQMSAGDTAFVQLINNSASGSTTIQGSGTTMPSNFSGYMINPT